MPTISGSGADPNQPQRAVEHRIRVGVGGWIYPGWRGSFYPPGLPQHRELEYASRRLTAIEVNSTFYATQQPATFARWRDETPPDFVLSLKAPRFATNRRVLGSAGESIARFIDSGIAELGSKLGPILWQFAPTKQFAAEDFEAFLALLPRSIGDRALRHVLDVRHESFKVAGFLKLARKYDCVTVFTDSESYPSFADSTGNFIYARLMRSSDKWKAGYAPKALDAWARRARTWAAGGTPDDLPRIETAVEHSTGTEPTRDIFIFFIDGAKERAPAAASALLDRLGAE